MLSVVMQNAILLSVLVHTKPPLKGNIYNMKNFIYFTQNKKGYRGSICLMTFSITTTDATNVILRTVIYATHVFLNCYA
jgi:hypothetical protein